jgi:tRNA-binding EMAP/Myf-like protein
VNPAPIKPLISISDLDKIDVRVGTILAVEDVAHSEKLVRLRVDFDDHPALHSRRHEKVAAISKGVDRRPVGPPFGVPILTRLWID